MTQIRLPDEINQLADQIKIGERFRTCDIHSKLKHRRNGVRLLQVGAYLARRDDIRSAGEGVWEKVEE
jgi:hypothetical protein